MSDEPTEKLPPDKPAPATAPTIETVLERMNALHSETMAAIAELHSRMEEAFADIKEIKHKMRVLNNSLLDMAGRQEDFEERGEKLERQPS